MDTPPPENTAFDALCFYAENNDFRVETSENKDIIILQHTISNDTQVDSLPEIQGFRYFLSVQHLRTSTIVRVVYTNIPPET